MNASCTIDGAFFMGDSKQTQIVPRTMDCVSNPMYTV